MVHKEPENIQYLIKTLQLEPHSEGGYFRRTFETRRTIETTQQTSINNNESIKRPFCTSIYYLLTSHSPIGCLHRNRSDIMHYFHCGSSLNYYTVDESHSLHTHVLGNDLGLGQRPQLLVPGGYWKATELQSGEFALISEMVSPGFEYSDRELADNTESFPAQIANFLDRFIR